MNLKDLQNRIMLIGEKLGLPIIIAAVTSIITTHCVNPPPKSQIWQVKTVSEIGRDARADFYIDIYKDGFFGRDGFFGGESFWTTGSGGIGKEQPNKVYGTIKNNNDIYLERYLAGDELGKRQSWTGNISSDGTTAKGEWTGPVGDGTYGTWEATIREIRKFKNQ